MSDPLDIVAAGLEERPLRYEYDNTPGVQDLLKEFNEKKGYYVVGNFGGKVVVCWEAPDANFPGVRTPVLHRLSFYDFSNCYMNQLVRVGGTEEEPKWVSKAEA